MNKPPLSLALCLCALLLTACGDSDSTPEAVFTQCEDQVIARFATKEVVVDAWHNRTRENGFLPETIYVYDFRREGTFYASTRNLASCPFSSNPRLDACVEKYQGTYELNEGLITLTADTGDIHQLQINRIYTNYGKCKAASGTGACRIELSSKDFCNKQFATGANAANG